MEKSGGPKATWSLLEYIGVAICLCSFYTFTKLPFLWILQSSSYLILFYAALVVLGIPLMYVQLKLGGEHKKGMIGVLGKGFPILKGIGIAVMIKLFIQNIAASVDIGTQIHFAAEHLGNHANGTLPWTHCGNAWNTDQCTTKSAFDVMPPPSAKAMATGGQNGSTPMPSRSAEIEYIYFKMLQLTQSVDSPKGMDWPAPVCMIAAWGVILFLIFGGLKWFGKICTVLALAVIVMAIAFLAYGHVEVAGMNDSFTNILYKARWEVIATDAKESFLQVWVKNMASVVELLLFFDGVLPTIGKNLGTGRARSNLMWLVVLLVASVLPHLFANTIVPYLHVASPSSWLDNWSYGGLNIMVGISRFSTKLNLNRAISFAMFVFTILIGLLFQGLLALTVVDNIVDGMWDGAKKKLKKRTVLHLLISLAYVIVGMALALAQVTKGGLHLQFLVEISVNHLMCVIALLSVIAYAVTYANQQYHVANKALFLIWFILSGLFCAFLFVWTMDRKFWKETQDPKYRIIQALVGFNPLSVYPLWSYAIKWLIAGGPIFVGVLVGMIHSLVTASAPKCKTACCGSAEDKEEKGFDY